MLWPHTLSLGEIVYPPGSAFGPRIQPSVQLVFIHSGEMTVWIDGQPRYAPAHTASILFPGHEERFAFARDTETWHSWIHLHFADFPDVLLERFARLPWPLPLSQAMHDLIRSALALRNTPLSTADPMLKALGLQMLWLYLGEGERDEHDGHRLVEAARVYVQSHLADPLTLDEIAAAVSLSPAHLVRLFRAHLSQTPIAYVWERRVAAGVELLKGSGLPVGVIAERCGFQTSYHFSRRVRQSTGLTPSEIRARSWQRG